MEQFSATAAPDTLLCMVITIIGAASEHGDDEEPECDAGSDAQPGPADVAAREHSRRIQRHATNVSTMVNCMQCIDLCVL